MKEKRIKGIFFFHRASRLHKNRFPKRNRVSSKNFEYHPVRNNGYKVVPIHLWYECTPAVPVHQPVHGSNIQTSQQCYPL